ncbi:ABC transporter, ATP-binding protein [Dictyocaulus viviparus]|uniref:ABC-type xenobiotic transporter n=1 Tax=Dictyocaulus viviparus TaxID=29172 RepID=A0A0D8XIP5_DICVI|nr:ABC transporter, ATP-binding protein [Dictyocaulus viviparus]
MHRLRFIFIFPIKRSNDTGTSEERPVKKVSIAQLFRYAKWKELVLLFVGIGVSLVTGAGLPLMSILQGKVTQAFVNEEMFKTNITPGPDFHYNDTNFTNDVMNIIYGYIAIAVGMFIAANLQVTCFLIVCEQISNRIRRKFVQAILRQNISWFDKNNSGALATKLFDDLERVKEGTGDKIGLMFQFTSQFVTGFIIAFLHSWKLTLVMLAVTPLQALCGFAISKSMTTFTIAETIKYGKAGKIVEQTISSIRTVCALNGLHFEIERYKMALSEARRAGMLKNLAIGLSFCLMGLTNFSSLALAFYVGITWVVDGDLNLQELLTTFFSVMMGAIALGQAGPQFAVLGAAQGAAASIYEILDREPEIDSTSKTGRRGMAIEGNVELKNVVFNYPSRPDVQVLKNLSLSVKAGETVALVGSSGCGKSTIVSLLLRYYDVMEGEITIDGIPITEFNIEYLRNQIAVVSQEPILFNCTIEENIRYGNCSINHHQLVAACRMANADSFISNLPQGYQTVVGDRGIQLSGGQKQRIAIARALVRDPKILLLDEATSALDAESEAVVQKALEKASIGRTTIIIAHRLSTIKNANKIIAMKDGQVIEFGTHDELMKHKGLYYHLVQSQTFIDIADNVNAHNEEDKLTMISAERSSLLSRETSIQTVNDMQIRLRSATIMTLDKQQSIDESRIEKDEIARLRKEMKAEGVQKTNLLEILSYCKPQWKPLTIGLTTCIIGGLVFPAYSVVFMQVITAFSDTSTLLKIGHFWALMFLVLAVIQGVTLFAQAFSDTSTLLKIGHFWALMFLVLAVIQGVTLFAQTFFMGVGAENMAFDLRWKVFSNLLSQDIGYFDSPLHACGRICTRLASDVPNLRSAIDFRLSTVVCTIVSIVAGIVLAFYYGWQMALLVVGILPLLGIGQSLRVRVMRGVHRKNAKDFEDSGKIAMEAIEHVRTVQALTKEDVIYEKFCHYLDGPHSDALRESCIQGIAYGFATSVLYVLNCCSYRLGLSLIINNVMLPIEVLRVMYAITISSSTLGFASSFFPEYMKAKFAGGIIFNMLRQKSKIDNISSEGKKANLSGAVTFKNVRFSYPERQQVDVLKGLSFTAKPGETLALVGPSGCGKSTVVSLIERFYDVKSGQVLLDSHDIRSLNPIHTRSQIAIVSQEPILFNCSIAENIAYGMKEFPTQAEIEIAARKANIHSFISELPDGYNTTVGDKGTQLSGGQKQRIAIARALVRSPKILLLDEATSALDTESEKIVQDALDRAREGRTCIVIAHRLSTIVNADSIAVMKGGVIIEQGTHSQLMARRGFYYELTQNQVRKDSTE